MKPMVLQGLGRGPAGRGVGRAIARFWALGDYLEVELTVPRSRRAPRAGGPLLT